MASTITKEQSIEILKCFNDETLQKPQWYLDIEYPSFNIDPNDFIFDEIKDFCCGHECNKEFLVFDGFKNLYLKHKSHKEWYCYYTTNFFDVKFSIDYNVIPTENDKEYIVFNNGHPILMKEVVNTDNFKAIFSGFKNKDQVREFIIWYGEQGEQDSDIWLEENGGFTAHVNDYNISETENTIECLVEINE